MVVWGLAVLHSTVRQCVTVLRTELYLSLELLRTRTLDVLTRRTTPVGQHFPMVHSTLPTVVVSSCLLRTL